MKYKLRKIKDIFLNLFDFKNRLIYIVESNDWSIMWDGKQITEALNELGLLNGTIRTTHRGLRNKIVHFGSINTLIKRRKLGKINKSNKIIVTWFHVVDEDQYSKNIPELVKHVNLFHTASSISKIKLISLGIPKDKIVVIPLGVDLSRFKPISEEGKIRLKKKLCLPLDKIIIGSFQKDGVGWGEGNQPKLIKGPDIFCEVVEKLAKKYGIFILLTGPARGYVKNRLEKANILYKHVYLKNYLDIKEYYQSLDLYIMTSRTEGGPKAIIESWATGVPVVSTKVGMTPDIASHQNNVYLTKVEDVDDLAKGAELIISDHILRNNIIKQGLKEVERYSWSNIASMYYQNIYS